MANLYWNPADASPHDIADPANYRTGSPSGSAASGFSSGDNLYFLLGAGVVEGAFSAETFANVLISEQCASSFGTASSAITGATVTGSLLVRGSGANHYFGISVSGISGFTPANKGARVFLTAGTWANVQFDGCQFEVGSSAVVTNYVASNGARGTILSNGTGITSGSNESRSVVYTYRNGTYEAANASLSVLGAAVLTSGRARGGGVLSDESTANHTTVIVHPGGQFRTDRCPSPAKTVTNLTLYAGGLAGTRTSIGAMTYTNQTVFGLNAETPPLGMPS